MQAKGGLDLVANFMFSQDLSVWVGFFFSLMIFSMLAGENLFSKLAQYILVGVGMGYLGALAIQHVLRPRLFLPLMGNPVDLSRWLVLILGVLLCVAGLERIIAQNAPPETVDQPWHGRRLLRQLGTVPVAILLGTAVSVLVIGVLQGTIWPQFWQTARTGLTVMATVGGTLSTVLLLILTTATLLHWSVPVVSLTDDQPGWVRHLLRWWAGLGKRALWFASGVLFARLFASHLSLLIARVQFLRDGLEQSALWLWVEAIWRGIVGG